MAERTLAQNVAQAKADFKAIKDAIYSQVGYDLDNVPTNEYGNKVNDACTEMYGIGRGDGIMEGYENGKSEGIDEGYTSGKVDGIYEGIEQGIEQGRQAQRLEWWGKYLNNGLSGSGAGAFYGHRWTDDTFDPPFDINASNSSTMFGLSQIKDVRGILARNRVNLIFNDSTSYFNQHFNVFSNSAVVYLPYLKLPSTSAAYGWFSGCSKLKEVDGYECLARHAFESGTSTNNKTFYNCTELVHIIFHGTIGQSINLQWSTKLDYESATSALKCLKDFSGTEEGYTRMVIFASSVWEMLANYGDDAVHPLTGDPCTWAEYVDAIAWIKQ